jgi:RNA polymerase sigma-70 factor (ECF subfamily)
MFIPDDELIAQLRAGSEKAYRQLYMQHYEVLCRISYGWLRDRFLAEAVVNQLIADIWEKRATLLFGGTLRNYLVRAVRNRCINYLQLEHVRTEIPAADLHDGTLQLNEPFDEALPHATLIAGELEADINKSVAAMAPECRRVFELSRFEELSHQQIAEKLNISVNTVKYHIKNALARLRADLSAYLTTLLLFFFNF